MSDQPSEHSEDNSEKEAELIEAIEFSRRVISAVGDGLEKVLKAKDQGLIKQKRKATKLGKKLKKNQDEIMKAFLFSVKPEFRDTYIEVIKKVTEAAPEAL